MNSYVMLNYLLISNIICIYKIICIDKAKIISSISPVPIHNVRMEKPNTHCTNGKMIYFLAGTVFIISVGSE